MPIGRSHRRRALLAPAFRALGWAVLVAGGAVAAFNAAVVKALSP
jgi:hypothetical protein